ncbi:MAG: enoyl-CoA hydratase/isomerase family protein [Chloroflexi bacterium]|nr:enoyl-CoA hydratase/isomerase family protein [Chloroflexota bacterium]MBU1751501.1 enoyl-CoA hydratase/isomerase family protein [Chloroflexota bacterium]
MSYQNLIVAREQGVGIITFNRPKALNALSRATVAELSAAIDELNADETVGAIVITGAGDRAFVAGADIGEFNDIASAQMAAEFARKGQAVLDKIEALPKPVLMAINGFALGGGCELAMAGDIRIAADTAKLGQPEINLGLIPGYGGTQRLPRLVGRGMAKYLVLSGDMIDAAEAHRIGLVDFVVPAGELMEFTLKLAHKLAGKAPIALNLAKRAINEGLAGSLADGLLHEADLFGLVFATEDRVEGVSAFLSKRKPAFKGQ